MFSFIGKIEFFSKVQNEFDLQMSAFTLLHTQPELGQQCQVISNGKEKGRKDDSDWLQE